MSPGEPGVKLLALDTATDTMAVALVDAGQQHVSNLPGGAAASATVLPHILSLLAQQGWRMADLDAVAFGCGPGAFTGLRTAVSVAQGLAFGLDRPVLAIDSLLIVAEDARAQARLAADEPFELWVAMDARMDEVYAAAYRHDGLTWTAQRAPALYDLPTLNASWRGHAPGHLAGNAPAAFGERLPSSGPSLWPNVGDRAAALARLARAAWLAGAGQPADQALPLYLRDKVALTTAERQAAKDAVATSGAVPT